MLKGKRFTSSRRLELLKEFVAVPREDEVRFLEANVTSRQELRGIALRWLSQIGAGHPPTP